MHRALVLALTSMVWLPAQAPASAAAGCDHIVSFRATADGDLTPGIDVISLTETSGLVAFALTDPNWEIVTASVGFASSEAGEARIGGQQIVASPGPEGVLVRGESFEFCLRSAPAQLQEEASELTARYPTPHQARPRILAL